MESFALPTTDGYLSVSFEPKCDFGLLELKACESQSELVLGCGPADEIYHRLMAWLDGDYPNIDVLTSVADHQQRPWYTTRMQPCFVLEGYTTAIVSVDETDRIEFLDKDMQTICAYRLSKAAVDEWKKSLEDCLMQSASSEWIGWRRTHFRDTRQPMPTHQWRALQAMRNKISENVRRVEESIPKNK